MIIQVCNMQYNNDILSTKICVFIQNMSLFLRDLSTLTGLLVIVIITYECMPTDQVPTFSKNLIGL